MITNDEYLKLVALRETLHQNPEVSGQEKNTTQRIISFMKDYNPDEIIENIAGYSFAIVYNSHQPGKKVLFRADIDAIPVKEKNTFTYSSNCKTAAHLCGHDGHSSILCALGVLLHHTPPQSGQVILLFQAEEENGQGAKKIVESEWFKQLKPDFIFGLHNIPKYPLGEVLVRNKNFAAASTGIEIELKGKTAHAGQPETGINPSLCISELIQFISNLPKHSNFENRFVLATIVHCVIGEHTYGTSAGNGILRATLRSYENTDMNLLCKMIENFTYEKTKEFKLNFDIKYHEYFPALVNNSSLAERFFQTIEKENIPHRKLEKAFRWSEDFSHYSLNTPSVFFGLGSGEIADLHDPFYDFPNELIKKGSSLFYLIQKSLLL